MEGNNLKDLINAKKAEREALAKDVADFEALLTDYFGEHVKYVDGSLSWTSGDDGPNAVVVSFGPVSFNSKTGWVSGCLIRIDGRFNAHEPANVDYGGLGGNYKMDNTDRRYILDNAPAIFESYKKQALAEFDKDAAVRTKFEAFKKSVKGNKP